MSASDKKKIRKEQENIYITQKQKAAQAEARKLKIYTISFVSVMLLVVVTLLGVLGFRAVKNYGFAERNTIAATVDGVKLSSVEMSYYYNDTISEYYNDIYSQFSDSAEQYLATMGLDRSKPLTEQIQDTESGKTWATYFLEEALNKAKISYAMYNLAVKEGFELSEEEKAGLESLEENLKTYAKLSGYPGTNQYLRDIYGYGATLKSYMAYTERTQIADAYTFAHYDKLTYDDAAIRQYEAGKEGDYNSYSYDYSYMSYTEFRTGGTEDAEGKKTYTEEENNAARAAMKAAAEEMATATSLEELKAKADTVKVNEDSEVVVNAYNDELATGINAALLKWLSDAERKEGDIAAIPNESTVKNEDGTETTVVNGYYVAHFRSKSDNTGKMSNVRHLLVEFECTQEGEHEHTEFTEEEKAAAKAKADGYYKTWSEGAKTEESFIELVKAHSDDTSAATGGLFENVNPGSSYVHNFLHWSIDANRKPGDCEVIESEYGYHVMYFVGHTEMNYRDYMITEEMRAEDHEKWYNGIVDGATASLADTSKMNLDVA